MDVSELDILLTRHGGLTKYEDTPRRYLKLFFHALPFTSNKMLSILLDPLLKTKNTSILASIIQPGQQILSAIPPSLLRNDTITIDNKFAGLQILSYILHHYESVFLKTPILRKTLRVLHDLEDLGVIRGSELYGCSPCFCFLDFSKILFNLTKHDDLQVQELARGLETLSCAMPLDDPSHEGCKRVKLLEAELGRQAELVERARVAKQAELQTRTELKKQAELVKKTGTGEALRIIEAEIAWREERAKEAELERQFELSRQGDLVSELVKQWELMKQARTYEANGNWEASGATEASASREASGSEEASWSSEASGN